MIYTDAEQRYRLCQAIVTLNNQPAKICGARNDFATVRILSTGESYEWSWIAVARIVASGGNFKS